MEELMEKDRAGLTVIIPTYNRAEVLGMCLKSLALQTIPPESFQVIVSDDGSTDDTRQKAEPFLDGVFLHAKYLRQPNSGQNAARNRAIEEAEGEILLFINDDTVATPSMVEEHRLFHEQNRAPNMAMLGRITISPDLPPSVFATLHLDAAYEQWEGKAEVDWRAFYTCNVSVKKAFLLEHGLFDESLRYNDDLELALRLTKYGLRIMYNPRSLGYHYHFLTEESFSNVAKLSGKTLAVWHRNAPELTKELASIGFYPAAPFFQRIKYHLADMVLNKATMPFFFRLARRFAGNRKDLSVMIYKKLYKALERQNIRDEMSLSGRP